MALNRPAGASVAEELSILRAHVSIHSSATDMQFSATQGARRVHHSRPAQLFALPPMPPYVTATIAALTAVSTHAPTVLDVSTHAAVSAAASAQARVAVAALPAARVAARVAATTTKGRRAEAGAGGSGDSVGSGCGDGAAACGDAYACCGDGDPADGVMARVTKAATPQQQQAHSQMRRAGVRVYVVRDKADFYNKLMDYTHGEVGDECVEMCARSPEQAKAARAWAPTPQGKRARVN